MAEISDSKKTLRLNNADNVVVARADLTRNTLIEEESIVLKDDVPVGHKVATTNIKKGEPVRKYDQIIGFALSDIEAGCHVHTHNLEFKDFQRDYAYASASSETRYVPESERATFDGFVRADGRVGTRNYIGILASVNCSNSVARQISDCFMGDTLKAFPNVDGVVALPHQTGCCIPLDAHTHSNLERTIAGYIRHPNFAGVLLIGLGCEVAQIDNLVQKQNLERSEKFRTMVIQEIGGTAKTVATGKQYVLEMLEIANSAARVRRPASDLIIGLECGGSDAFSGITANPALGVASDLIVSQGGTVILGETPEIYGAEHLLTQRGKNREVCEKLIERIRWWEQHTRSHNARMDNNPTPGNKKGGLSTILEKSLGAVAKGGTSRLMDVYEYAEPVTTKGLVFMDTPGYDPCSITGFVAGGANVLCFTTGRGSVYGCKPVPSIKLATNTPLYENMKDDMDINCGVIADGHKSIGETGDEIFRMILETASGRYTRSEIHGIGDLEFVPWQISDVL